VKLILLSSFVVACSCLAGIMKIAVTLLILASNVAFCDGQPQFLPASAFPAAPACIPPTFCDDDDLENLSFDEFKCISTLMQLVLRGGRVICGAAAVAADPVAVASPFALTSAGAVPLTTSALNSLSEENNPGLFTISGDFAFDNLASLGEVNPFDRNGKPDFIPIGTTVFPPNGLRGPFP
jgi:hypothetical protein